MTALFVRNVQPQPYEPAHTAQQIVEWYSARPQVGLWLFLMAMPLAVLVSGCAVLRRNWKDDADLRRATEQTLAAIRAHLSIVLVAAATATATAVLAIVALHGMVN